MNSMGSQSLYGQPVTKKTQKFKGNSAHCFYPSCVIILTCACLVQTSLITDPTSCTGIQGNILIQILLPSVFMKNICSMVLVSPCDPCFPGSLRRQQFALLKANPKVLPHNTLFDTFIWNRCSINAIDWIAQCQGQWLVKLTRSQYGSLSLSRP